MMAGVRPATDADVSALQARAETVLRRTFTVTAVGGLGEFEMNWSPTHARVLFSVRSQVYLETHSTPGSTAPPEREAVLRGPLTVCLHQEARCTRITGDEDPGDRPHLFDTMTDSLVYLASASATAQAAAPQLLDEVRGPGATAALTTVESPIGRLDCVLLVEDAAALDRLEGKPLEPGSSESDHTVLCLDARGFVVVSPGASFLPLTAYTSMRPDVPAGFDRLPFAVHAYS
ncbi:hypothetical protein GCM10009845_11480 [Pedococcus bigeumensis]